MKRNIVYIFEKDSKIYHTLLKPDTDNYVTQIRLTADEGKCLTSGDNNFTLVVDVDDSQVLNWYEVDKPENFDDLI